MQKIYFILFFLLGHQLVIAANDTSWLNKKWRACNKDTAVYYSLSNKVDTSWHRKIYYISACKLYMEGDYTDSLFRIKQGILIGSIRMEAGKARPYIRRVSPLTSLIFILMEK